MSRDLVRTAEIKDQVRDAYRHAPPTTAAVAHNLAVVVKSLLSPMR